jgi:transcriptional regulator with XRE-family HTH domain
MTRRANDIFAVRFDEALTADGRTNEQFARDVGFTLRTITRWRAGDSAPTGASLIRLAVALGREPGWFYIEPNGQEAA